MFNLSKTSPRDVESQIKKHNKLRRIWPEIYLQYLNQILIRIGKFIVQNIIIIIPNGILYIL